MTNTNMSRQSKLVYQKLQEILESYFSGIPMSGLPWLERCYQNKFNKSLDYESLGVKDIEQLVVMMGNKGMVVFFKGRDSEEEYLMSARMVEIRQKVYLKDEVEKLLNRYGGKIAFESFEDLYKDQFKFHIDYDYYALTDLDHLCQVLKDILVVEVANPSGAKVIKAAAVKIYNLRKRKK